LSFSLIFGFAFDGGRIAKTKMHQKASDRLIAVLPLQYNDSKD
jgi:hypothetical protein